MRGYSEDVLGDVRAKSDIVEVISGYVALKQTGKTYKGLCPFHTEKTPSFVVSPEKQLFHCFGCGAGGDVFSFIMRAENVGFAEAVKILADRAGILIREDSEEAREERERLRALYEVNEAACEYFQRVLMESPEAGAAREYVRRRGIRDEIVRKFRLGYALPSWDALLKALTASKIPREALLDAGLVAQGKDPGGHYDRFRARLMFPICDAQGRVLGFGGRVLDDSVPKYLNSPETALFKKGRNLYGLHLAKDAIRRESTAVIVEGYMDAIASHQHGFGHVVASLGTALTEDQARIIRRYASRVVIAYDADAAGAAATVRGMEILAGARLDVRVASLPAGEDPDSTVRKGGAEALARALTDARPLIDYKLHLATSRCDRGTVDGRVSAAREAARVLATIESAVGRSEYTRRVATELEIDPDALGKDVEALVRAGGARPARPGRGGRPRVAVRPEESGPSGDRNVASRHTKSEDDIARSGEMMKVLEAEKMLLRLMAESGEVRRIVVEQVGADGFCDPGHREIARAIVVEGVMARSGSGGGAEAEGGGGGDAVEPTRVMAALDDEETRRYAAGIFLGQAGEGQGDPSRMAQDCLSVLREHSLRGRIREVERELASLGGTGETERSRALLAELGSLRSRLSKEFQPFSGIG
ncbi:MAG: DNA primase [Bacillota bacterium]